MFGGGEGPSPLPTGLSELVWKGVFLKGMLNSLTDPFPLLTSFFVSGCVVVVVVEVVGGVVLSELVGVVVVLFGGVYFIGMEEEEEEEGECGEGGTMPVGLDLGLTRGVPVLSRPAGCREVGLFTELPFRKLGSGLTGVEISTNYFTNTHLMNSKHTN